MLQYKRGMILNQPVPTNMQSIQQRIVLYSVVGASTTAVSVEVERETEQARTRRFQRGLMIIVPQRQGTPIKLA